MAIRHNYKVIDSLKWGEADYAKVVDKDGRIIEYRRIENHIYWSSFVNGHTSSGRIYCYKDDIPKKRKIKKVKSEYSSEIMHRVSGRERVFKDLDTDMWTLTYPDTYDEEMRFHDKKEMLVFFRKLYNAGIWVTEFHGRGMVHFHIVGVLPNGYRENKNWNLKDIIRFKCELSKQRIGFINSYNIQRAKHGKYLSYIAKENQKKGTVSGKNRLWGSWGNVEAIVNEPLLTGASFLQGQIKKVDLLKNKTIFEI